jgi:hypothetical protein
VRSGTRRRSQLCRGDASIPQLARLDAWLGKKCKMQRVFAILAIAAFNADATGKAYASPADARAGVAAMIQRGDDNPRFNNVLLRCCPSMLSGFKIISAQFLTRLRRLS